MATYVGKIKVDGTNELPVASTLYGTCSTAAGTTIKNVVCANFDKLITGVTIHVKFDNGLAGTSAKIKFNGESDTNAKNLYRNGTTSPSTYASWDSGSVVSMTYDGSSWIMNDCYFYDSNSDKYVQQDNLTSDSTKRVLLAYTNADTSITNITYKSGNLTFNPSTSVLSVGGVDVGAVGYPVVTTLPATVAWNTEYRLASATSSISFTLPAIVARGSETRVLFEAGDNPSLTITPPSGVTLYGISDIAISSGKRYELSAAVIGPSQIGVLCKEWG